MPFRVETDGNAFQLVDNATGEILENCYQSSETWFRFGNATDSIIFIGTGPNTNKTLYPSVTPVAGAANQRDREFLLSELLDSAGVAWLDFNALLSFLKNSLGGFNGAAATGPGIGLTQMSIAQYNDTQYTNASRLTLVGGAPDVVVPNNAVSIREVKLIPNQVKLYDPVTQSFSGLNNQWFSLNVYLRADPQIPVSWMRMYLYDGVTQIVREAKDFPLGAGANNDLVFNFNELTTLNLENNTAQLFMLSGVAMDIEIWDIRYHVTLNN